MVQFPSILEGSPIHLKPPLSRRLHALALQVPAGAKLVDVGTDHGLLPLWLLAQGRIATAIGVDRSAAALAAARRNQLRFGLPLDLQVGVGLVSVQGRDFDCMTMAGMGAEEIITTLAAAPPQLAWVGLQPHRGADVLRTWLHRAGWTIVGEQVVEENGLFHPLFWAIGEPDPVAITGPERSFGRLSLHRDPQTLRRYLEAEHKRCTAPLLLERGGHVQVVLEALKQDISPR